MSSMNNHYKPLSSQVHINKENAPSSSNVSFEKQYSIIPKHRKVNEMLLKPSLAQYGHEPSYPHPTHLHHHLPSKPHKEGEVTRITNLRAKKTMPLERNSYNSRAGSISLNQKERSSAVTKENRMSLVERGERYSYEGSTKTSFIETQRAQIPEPIKISLVEKEPMKFVPVLEPVNKDNKLEAEAIPEKISNTIEPEVKKKTPQVVDFREQSNNTLKEYAPVIMESLKNKDKESTPLDCLKNHKIPANLRAKMIDWMVEVLGSYKCSDQTFFLAVNTMDLFFKMTNITQEVGDLHLVGVTCMFMASKYEEIYPLRLAVVHEKIAHKKLNLEQIKKKEMEIFSTLGYKLTNTTVYEFIINTLFQLNLKETLSPKLYEYLHKVCNYLAKSSVHDYELMSQQDLSELAAATLFVAFKIIEQLDKSFPLAQMVIKVNEILKVEEDIVYDCAARILSVAKNFDKLYPNLENLKKFHSFNFDDITSTSPTSKNEKAKH